MLDREEKYILSRNKLKRKIVTVMMGVLLILSCLLLYTAVHQGRLDVSTKVLAQSIYEAETASPSDDLIAAADSTIIAAVNNESVNIVNDDTEEAIPEDILNAKFIDKFTDGEVIITDNSYQSKNINISISDVTEKGYTYHIADIYVRDILNFRTAFADGEYGIGRKDSIQNISAENNAILALTGDFYSVQPSGIVIRNGELYRDIVWEMFLLCTMMAVWNPFLKASLILILYCKKEPIKHGLLDQCYWRMDNPKMDLIPKNRFFPKTPEAQLDITNQDITVS